MFTFAWLRAGARAGDRAVSRHRASAADRRLAALPALSDRGRQARRLRRAGAEVLGAVHARRSGLAPDLIDDSRDPAATKAAVADDHRASRPPSEWRPVFAAADCCVTIVASLEEALRDPHFVERGLFAHKVAGAVRRDHAGVAGADCRRAAREAGHEGCAETRSGQQSARVASLLATIRRPAIRAL